MKYHLYLSHVWSSGQDQMAFVKRQLQLLLPGISVFLECVPRAEAPAICPAPPLPTPVSPADDPWQMPPSGPLYANGHDTYFGQGGQEPRRPSM